MKKKIKLIQKFLKNNKLNFFLFTNSDIHLNESPNLILKDIYNLVSFDCSRGYLLVLENRIVFFTDSRYTLAASMHFDKSVLILDLKNNSIPDLINSFGFEYNGAIDPNLISINEFNSISKELKKNNNKIIPIKKFPLKKNYFPDFKKSYSFSLPKSYTPRNYMSNLFWLKKSLKSDGLLIWNNAHIAYLLNIRSFELENSTKPFAGLFIFKGNKKPIIISNNKFLNRIVKIKNEFHVMTEKIFINYINMQKIKSIELDYKYTNLNIYLSLIKLCKIQNSKINLDKFISKKPL